MRERTPVEDFPAPRILSGPVTAPSGLKPLSWYRTQFFRSKHTDPAVYSMLRRDNVECSRSFPPRRLKLYRRAVGGTAILVSVYFPFKRINTQNGEAIAVPFHVRLRVNKQRRVSVDGESLLLTRQTVRVMLLLEICFWFNRSLERDAPDSL